MIRFLHGIISLKDTTSVVVDVQGVGYQVYMAQKIQELIGAIGDTVHVFIYTHIREDILDLYGFLDYQDLTLFELLIGVSGIGPKTALGVFNNGNREEIINAILRSDTVFFQGIPRLGKKNAQKLIIELRGKVGGDGQILSVDMLGSDSEDVMDALRDFGYTAKEVQQALRAMGENAKTTEEKIKLALKYLGK